MSRAVLDLVSARRWAVTARVLLAGARERIDSLNVFPVADGDTGTNMYLTMDGALEFVRGQFELGAGTESLDEGLALIARGMLLAARGNSGVILSQLSRGLAEAVGPEVDAAGPGDIAVAFETAARTAWDAVASPVEGTILTVARAAAEGARAAVDRGRPLYGEDEPLDVLHVVREALAEARQALAHTPEQLAQLRHAGVVDAGGAGLVLVIEALEAVLDERPQLAVADLPVWWEVTTGGEPATGRAEDVARERTAASDRAQTCDLEEALDTHDGGSVEVMYLLTGSDTDRADRLRRHLARLGSSVVVAGGPEDYRVHVHLDDARQAVEAGTLAGQVDDVRLTSLVDGRTLDHGHLEDTGLAGPGDGGHEVPEPALAVVACALGEGVRTLFARAGAQVVPSGPRHRASAGQLLAAAYATGARRVVVLPNDSDTIMVARAAAEEAGREGVRVDVVPTHTLVQGLAAISLLDPESDADQTVATMTEAARGVRPGALTRADRTAETPVGRVRAGQWIGIADDGIVAVDDALAPVAAQVLDLLLNDGSEVLTLLLGADADEQEIGPVLADLAARHTEIEVERIDGGQPTYPYLLGVE
ncbi:DAK2 domain-containing protein [Ornithinimicrobium sp. LYQ103]|uniref:DAK2 domain-containing protein n=1 Tax=Ornithinimicrobium sp. LYQ103 TaxID=3378796 RepID=UPI0038519689